MKSKEESKNTQNPAKNRKLALTKETLRRLTSDDLRRAAGGNSDGCGPSVHIHCEEGP
jgi:hypothetical protein